MCQAKLEISEIILCFGFGRICKYCNRAKNEVDWEQYEKERKEYLLEIEKHKEFVKNYFKGKDKIK